MHTTSVTLGFNAQVRYYYSRYSTMASFSYDWKGRKRVSHALAPVYLNSVRITNINLFSKPISMPKPAKERKINTAATCFSAHVIR